MAFNLNAGASEWVPSFGNDPAPAPAAAEVALPYYEDNNAASAGAAGIDAHLDPAALAQLIAQAGAASGLDLGTLLAALPQISGAQQGAGQGGGSGGFTGLPGSSQSNMMMAMASGPFGAAGIARQERDNDAENLDEIEMAMQQAEIEAFLDSQGVTDPDERNRMMLELMQELREEGGSVSS